MLGSESPTLRPVPPPDDLAAELLDLAVGLAGEAGALLLDGLATVRAEISTKSSSTDMVTEMDRASERLIVEGILAVRPDDGVLGEEGAERSGTSGVRWVIDPIDGTTNYLYRRPGFAVSIAAEIDGEVAAGVVLDPMGGQTFAATRSGGATCNGAAIAVNTTEDLARALIGTGFSYEADRRRRQADVLVAVLPLVRDIRRSGSAASDLCWVACGWLDGFYERGLAPWDHRAGALIATEAGARVGDLRGGHDLTRFTLAASPALFEELGRLLSVADADHA
ncbi:inositol monophosphatase family protein [soil metagenome]